MRRDGLAAKRRRSTPPRASKRRPLTPPSPSAHRAERLGNLCLRRLQRVVGDKAQQPQAAQRVLEDGDEAVRLGAGAHFFFEFDLIARDAVDLMRTCNLYDWVWLIIYTLLFEQNMTERSEK